MDEGIILRSLFSLILKLKEYYDNSITARITGAISSFFRSLAEGSRIAVYFRRYEMKSPLWADSDFRKALDFSTTKLKKAAALLSDFILNLFEGSRIISYYHSAFNSIENNLLKSLGIFSGTASAAYLAASLLGADFNTKRLYISLSIIVLSTVLILLPLDIRKASEGSIFFRLVKYIFS